ncbi:FAD dependent oxidoreductase [Auriculariales sp. MPI-PUGE-AT-0066]|nr:FAD dependent oxidoreductase [Auriculariales sp. MPI-PUGE-AT-0066]
MPLSISLNIHREHSRFLSEYQPTPTERRTSLPVSHPTASFWLNSSPDANPLATQGSTGLLTSDADVVIIGSGITGVFAAYHLAKSFQDERSSKKIVVLEARDFCSGATGRNGGHLTEHLIFWFDPGVPTATALRECELEHHTVSNVARLVRQHPDWADDIDYVEGSRFVLFFSPEEEQDGRQRFEAARAAGLDLSEVKWFTCGEMMQTHSINYPAIRLPARNLWPLKLVTKVFELASSCSGSNITLHTHTPATKVVQNGRGWTVHTPRGAIKTAYVIHATNGYAGHLLPGLTGPEGVIPVRGQVVATRASQLVAARESYAGNHGFEYWFPRPIKERGELPLIILGGGRETQGQFETYQTDDAHLNDKVGAVLRKFLPSLSPEIFERGKQPEMEWTGIMGFTQSGAPFVGPVLERNSRQSAVLNGQYICAGYTGHGMPRAYACAEAVAGMIVADMRSERWQQPSWLPDNYLTYNRT